jgi:hypothetical protein
MPYGVDSHIRVEPTTAATAECPTRGFADGGPTQETRGKDTRGTAPHMDPSQFAAEQGDLA